MFNARKNLTSQTTRSAAPFLPWTRPERVWRSKSAGFVREIEISRLQPVVPAKLSRQRTTIRPRENRERESIRADIKERDPAKALRLALATLNRYGL